MLTNSRIQNKWWAYIRVGLFSSGLIFKGNFVLVFRWAYFWVGLFFHGPIIEILRYIFLYIFFRTDLLTIFFSLHITFFVMNNNK